MDLKQEKYVRFAGERSKFNCAFLSRVRFHAEI